MKSKTIISKFFKPYFDKHPELNSLWFLIHDFDDGLYLAEEDAGVNGRRWDELRDEKMDNASDKIHNAINLIKESGVEATIIINELEKIVNKLHEDSYNSNPLNKIMDDVWNDKNRSELTKKVTKHLEKEIPWRYVDWCECTVHRDGTVEIDEHE